MRNTALSMFDDKCSGGSETANEVYCEDRTNTGQ